MKILCVIDVWDYNNNKRGKGFEYNTFYKYFLSKKYGVKLLNLNKLTINKLDEIASDFNPDLVFVVPTRKDYDYSIFKNLKFTTLAWMCDDKWRWEKFSKNICNNFDWVVTTDKLAIKKYKKIGYKNVIESQWAINETRQKSKLSKIKKHDVSFVGQINPWRKYLVDYLKSRGINVNCFGYGWENGKLSEGDMLQVFRDSKINLNISNSAKIDLSYLLTFNIKWLWSDLNFYNKLFMAFPVLHTLFHPKKKEDIKARFFEVTGEGGFLLSYDVWGIEDYFEKDKEIVVYISLDELVDKMNYYLKNGEKREKIAKAGLLRTIKDHTYDKRFSEIFNKIGI